jgi:hypothetical protein
MPQIGLVKQNNFLKMWSIDTYWFDFAIVSLIYAIGNIVMGHFEEHTPKWRRILKYVLTIVVVISIVHFSNRYFAYGLLGLVLLFAIYVHGHFLPKKGINGLTGEPKEKYYELRGWNKERLKR